MREEGEVARGLKNENELLKPSSAITFARLRVLDRQTRANGCALTGSLRCENNGNSQIPRSQYSSRRRRAGQDDRRISRTRGNLLAVALMISSPKARPIHLPTMGVPTSSSDLALGKARQGREKMESEELPVLLCIVVALRHGKVP